MENGTTKVSEDVLRGGRIGPTSGETRADDHPRDIEGTNYGKK